MRAGGSDQEPRSPPTAQTRDTLARPQTAIAALSPSPSALHLALSPLQSCPQPPPPR